MPTILPLGPQVQFIDAGPPPGSYDPSDYVVRLGALWLDISTANRPFLYLCTASSPSELRWLRISDLGGDFKDNIFVGRDAGQTISAGANGDRNVAIGVGAMPSATTAYQGVAIGHGAMRGRLTGNYNTAVGFDALAAGTTGSNNTVVGAAAAAAVTTGQTNTVMGVSALGSATTASNNTVLGAVAGASVSTEGGNTLVGASADIAPGVTNAAALGAGALAVESGAFALGSMTLVGSAGHVVAYLKINVNGNALRLALLDA